MNLDAKVTAAEAATKLHVSVQLIAAWRESGKLPVAGMRGHRKLYRWGDLIAVERDTRRSPKSHRQEAA